MSFQTILPSLSGLHVLALGSVTGMVLHTTFVTSMIQYKTLTRPQYGQLKARLFPSYFAISFLLSLFLAYSTNALGGTRWTTLMMTSASFSALLNLKVVEPSMHAAKERKAQDLKDGKETAMSIHKQFKRMHAASFLLNLVVVVAAVQNCLWVGAQFGANLAAKQ
ncbi:hypothetical protein HDU98_004096 [Podochytrium sp. JEL0797]|nr:hypothetical protein HDU98_004096 [Podochytrium sp. JEL0797]